MKFIFTFFINMLCILIARHIIPGFSFQGDTLLLLEASGILTIMNYTLKPILAFVFFPFILLTLGLFTIAINMLVLWIITQFPLGVQNQSTEALLYTTLFFSIINTLLHHPRFSK